MVSEWPRERILMLAQALTEVTWLLGDGFRSPPPVEHPFWAKMAAVCKQSCGDLASLECARPALTAEELCEAVHSELECCDLFEIRPKALFLGSRESAESKLALATLGVEGIVAVSGPECTAKFDGVFAVHHVRPSEPLGEQLDSCMRFIRRLSGPVLVCSALEGEGIAAMICAAALAVKEGIATAAVAVEQIEKRRGPLRIEIDGAPRAIGCASPQGSERRPCPPMLIPPT